MKVRDFMYLLNGRIGEISLTIYCDEVAGVRYFKTFYDETISRDIPYTVLDMEVHVISPIKKGVINVIITERFDTLRAFSETVENIEHELALISSVLENEVL